MTKLQLFLSKFIKKYKIMKEIMNAEIERLEKEKAEQEIEKQHRENAAFVDEFERILSSSPEQLSHCRPELSLQLNQILLRRATDVRYKFLVDNIERYISIKYV